MGRSHAAQQDNVVRRNFAGADFALVNRALSKIDWSVNLCHGTVEDNIEEFYRLVNNVVDEFVPLRERAPSQYPCWYNAELIKLIKLKKHQHCTWKCTRSETDRIEFSRIRAQCIRSSRLAYKEYLARTESGLSRDARSFWKFVQNMSKDNSMPRSMTHGLAVAHSDRDIANLFSEHFGSVYSTSSLADFDYSDVSPFENLPVVTTQDVESLCADLDGNANPGPDGLPALFIKECVPSLKVPIAHSLISPSSKALSHRLGRGPLFSRYSRAGTGAASATTGRYLSSALFRNY